MIQPLSPTKVFSLTALTALALAACADAAEVRYNDPPTQQSSHRVSIELTSSSSSTPLPTTVPSSSKKAEPVSNDAPKSVSIAVPFSPQAPFAEWDALHEEACEEMSLIMVQRYWNKQSLSRDQAEAEVQKLIAWETDHGYGYDVNMDQLKSIAKDFYGITARVETDVSEAKLKAILASGKPIIVPAAGRELGNPYFSGEGPWYHVLVLVGYDGKNFITNDPGTKRGEGYKYTYATLISTIHDWTGVKEEISSGRKVVLVVEP